MKRIIAITIATLLLSANSFCQRDSSNEENKTFNLEEFKKCYDDVISENLEDTKALQQNYFDAFPSTFLDMVTVFGYQEDTNGFKFSPLYHDSHQYIDLLFQLDSIPDEEFNNKLIQICREGYWQADGINYFKAILWKRVESNPVAFINTLSNHPDDTIYGFWRFYFDEPHPVKEIPSYMHDLKDSDQSLYDIMSKALTDIQAEWEKDH